MKSPRRSPAFQLLGMAAALGLAMTGCEEQPPMGDVDQHLEDRPYTSEPRDDYQVRDLAISPADGDVTQPGQKIVFTVTGGQEPFSWSVATASGWIYEDGNERQAVYTSRDTGWNQVIARDRAGRVIKVDINL